MFVPGRKRVSVVLLLVLAAGLAAAAASAATNSSGMGCCPAGVDAAACTWLGSADCCPERPTATTPTHAAPPAPAACATLASPASAASPALLPSGASRALHTPRNAVLRL